MKSVIAAIAIIAASTSFAAEAKMPNDPQEHKLIKACLKANGQSTVYFRTWDLYSKTNSASGYKSRTYTAGSKFMSCMFNKNGTVRTASIVK